MIKLKIWLTVLTLYEIVAVLLLHCSRVCNAMFGLNFCSDHVFKYFIALFAVPAIITLIVMWIMEIIHTARRRQTLVFKAKTAIKDMAEKLRDKVSENVSTKDLEKLAAAAFVAGVQRYSANHPRMRNKIREILNLDIADYIDGWQEEEEYDASQEDEDDDYDDSDYKKSRNQNRRSNNNRNNKQMNRKRR